MTVHSVYKGRLKYHILKGSREANQAGSLH